MNEPVKEPVNASVKVVNCNELLINVGFPVNSENVTGFPINLYLKSNDAVVCSDPLIIPEGLDAMLSHVVWVIEPLATYLVSYELVNWDEPEITPVGNCAEPLIIPLPVVS